MDNGFRYPGEFEPQTDVFVEWVPFAEPIKGYDAWAPITEIVRNLMEEVTFISIAADGRWPFG